MAKIGMLLICIIEKSEFRISNITNVGKQLLFQKTTDQPFKNIGGKEQ